MPLVVFSLTGDTSNVFNWSWSITPGGTQDLSMLLQMLQEHYCGSYTLREQRNMVENLCQGACEDATDFMIRVGKTISNLGKDWKNQLTEGELQSLQYEVSLNGVREEIQHVLDSEIARHGRLTLHQMYEVVKKYEMYVACNKCLKGKSASSNTNLQRPVAQTSGYKPHFHKTITLTTLVKETTDPALSEPGHTLPEDEDQSEVEPTRKDDEGLFIIVSWKRLWEVMVTFKLRWPTPCRHKRSMIEDASSVSHWTILWGTTTKEKMGRGPSSWDGKSLSTRSSNVSGRPSKMKSASYLNPNPYCWFIGPKNLGEALIGGELVTCLLDSGVQLSFVTTTYACKQGMDIMSLDSLAQEIGRQIPPIAGIGGIMVQPEGFVMMNVQIPCVKGYNEDQIAIVMDDPGMKDFWSSWACLQSIEWWKLSRRARSLSWPYPGPPPESLGWWEQ